MGQKKVEKVERIAKGAMREFGFRGIDLFSRLMQQRYQKKKPLEAPAKEEKTKLTEPTEFIIVRTRFSRKIENCESEKLLQPQICVPSEQSTIKIESIKSDEPLMDVKLQEMIQEIKIDESIKDQFLSIEDWMGKKTSKVKKWLGTAEARKLSFIDRQKVKSLLRRVNCHPE
ncbi:unnamed protein product [Oikopleura dioica]|uniref:Uncharacterized protein n=1 Tax=Oikopleura dioica TaxID=34765 RepID=E4XJW2_OIKDI|nr:unnamed protein product [Oikopleura dioica]